MSESIKTGSDALMYFNQPDFASYQAFMILKKEHEDLKKEFDALKFDTAKAESRGYTNYEASIMSIKRILKEHDNSNSEEWYRNMAIVFKHQYLSTNDSFNSDIFKYC